MPLSIRPIGLRKLASLLPTVLVLAGCYTVDQRYFNSYANGLVQPGIKFKDAVSRLGEQGFECEGVTSAPETACRRPRHSLLPYTCIERIHLLPTQDGATVAAVSPQPIACAGL